MIRSLLALAAAALATLAAPAVAQISVAPGRQVICAPEKQPCVVSDYRVLDNTGKDASGMLVQGYDLRTTYMGVQLHNKATVAKGFTLRDSTIELTAQVAAGKIPVGVHLEWAEDALIDHVTVRGFKTLVKAGVYPNGDGLGDEFAVRPTYRWVWSIGNANGGIDSKGHDVKFDRTLMQDNAFGWRLWWERGHSFTTAGFVNNTVAAIQLTYSKTRGGVNLTGDTLIVDNALDRPIFVNGKGSGHKVKIGRCFIHAPVARPWYKGTAITFDVGPGCRDAAGNIAIDPRPWIKVATALKDSNNDGVVVSSGAVPVLGIKDTRWQLLGCLPDGCRYARMN